MGMQKVVMDCDTVLFLCFFINFFFVIFRCLGRLCGGGELKARTVHIGKPVRIIFCFCNEDFPLVFYLSRDKHWC